MLQDRGWSVAPCSARKRSSDHDNTQHRPKRLRPGTTPASPETRCAVARFDESVRSMILCHADASDEIEEYVLDGYNVRPVTETCETATCVEYIQYSLYDTVEERCV